MDPGSAAQAPAPGVTQNEAAYTPISAVIPESRNGLSGIQERRKNDARDKAHFAFDEIAKCLSLLLCRVSGR